VRRAAVVVIAMLGTLQAMSPSALALPGDQPKPPQNAPAANATFGAGPAGPKKADSRPYLTFVSSPSGTAVDHVAVTNYSHRPLRLNVYTVDAVPATNGAIAFKTKDASRDQAGAWMAVGTPGGTGVITVKPRSTDILPVRVRIPANASPGDHVGGVIVSLNGRVKGTFGRSGKEGARFEQRIAVRSVFRISGPLHPLLTIEALKASYSGPLNPFAKGHATVSYVVHNGGNVVLGGPQTVTVSGPFGHTTATDVPDVPALLPGGSFPVKVKVSGVYPQGVMKAKVTINTEPLQGEVDPGVKPVSSSVHFLAIPWFWLVVLLLLILGLAGYLIRRRHRQAAAVSPVQVEQLEGGRV
jgi:Bacterial protein of unknown function (DUF916)